MYFLALSWTATQVGTPAQAGMVLTAAALPRVLLMLGGGVLADRFGLRRLVIGSDAIRCLVMLLLAGALAVAAPGLWILVAVGLVFGAVDAVFLPAVDALPPRITAPEQLARVQGICGLSTRFAMTVGSPLGGVAMVVGGVEMAFAIAGALFALSVLLLMGVRIAPPPEDPGDEKPASRAATPARDLVDGLRHIRNNRVLTPLLVVLSLTELGFAGPTNIGMVLLSRERGWGAAGLSWIIAGVGTGAAAASLLLAVRGRLPRAGLVNQVCLLLGAGTLCSLPLVSSLPVAVGVAFALGLTLGISGALSGALLQTVTEHAFLGRVSSVAGLVSLGIAPMTYPVFGSAVAMWGVRDVFVGSALLVALGGVTGLCATSLRRVELPR
ncbi:Enterobactin exporter EntS (plasmid) [Streptomyces sp. enrichment culture]